MSWNCPLTKNNKCSELHAIAPDGGLRHYKKIYGEALAEKGWQHVEYPSRSYYFEYDKNHPSFLERDRMKFSETDEILEVIVL